MPSQFYSINELTERDNADPKIKTLLASFGVDNIEPTKQHTLVARNQQKTKILGVLIAEEFQKQTIKITYIYIKPMWRRLSIGNALIQRLEQECQLRGITTIKATFGRDNEAMNALTQSHKGWSDGERLNAYTFKSRTAMKPILQRLETTMNHRTQQTEIRALSECNPQDIIHASEMNHVPQWAQLNATNLSMAIGDLSRVFLHNNQIIGWLITFPLGDETLDYRILGIDDACRKTGLAIRALAEIIRKAHFQDNLRATTTSNDLGNPWPRGFFIMHSENQAMVNFANKRLASGTNQRSTLIYREKPIK